MRSSRGVVRTSASFLFSSSVNLGNVANACQYLSAAFPSESVLALPRNKIQKENLENRHGQTQSAQHERYLTFREVRVMMAGRIWIDSSVEQIRA